MTKVKDLKKYYEDLAKHTLTLFVNQKFEHLELLDKPDLQSDYLNVGIEVRECKNDDDGRTDAFIRETFNSDYSFEERKDKMRKMKVSGYLEQLPNSSGIIFSSSEGLSNIESIILKVLEAIIDKNVKFNTYKKFSLNCLYLFCKWNFQHFDIKEIIERIEVNNFDIIYFDCEDCLYSYDFREKSMNEYRFKLEEDDSYAVMLRNLKNKYWF